METLHALDRHCYDNVCHCDVRLSIHDCVESDIGRICNIINIALSALLSMTGCGLIYHRVVIKGCTFIDTAPRKGILRPKPIDSMLLFFTLFNFVRLADSIVLILNVLPENMAFRSFMWDNAFQWALSGFTLYIIGIAQALADTHSSISESWMPSPIIVDTIGLSIIITSNIINCILAIATGGVSGYSMAAAEGILRTHFLSWAILTSGVALAVIIFGSKLVYILNRQLKTIHSGNERHKKLKSGILRIRLNMAVISVCLFSFSATLIVYAAVRNQALKNQTGNGIICVLWNMLGSSTILIIESLLIFNPKAMAHSKGFTLKSSEEETGSNFMESQINSKAYDNTTFQDTLTRGTLDNLNLKYDELLKHSVEDDGEGSSNHALQKTKDLMKGIPEHVEVQRIGSRAVYINKKP